MTLRRGREGLNYLEMRGLWLGFNGMCKDCKVNLEPVNPLYFDKAKDFICLKCGRWLKITLWEPERP